MDRLETIALSSYLLISPYKRYVDDIYFQTPGEEMADQFRHTLKNLHAKMKFEIKKPETTPNDLSLSLLDFKNVYKGIKIKTIVLENDPANLCLFEAFYIRKYKPTLNSREECSEFADLLF